MTNIEGLQHKLPDSIEAVLIVSPVNRRYYTGFSSSAGALLITREKSCFIIDSRYFTAAKTLAQADEIILQDKLYEQILAFFKASDVKKVAVESDFTTISAMRVLEKNLDVIELVSENELSSIIARQRAVKTTAELAAVREAQRLTDETFAHICGFIRRGMTEREIALEMEFYSRRQGSEGPSFSYIVAAGANSAVPHAVPGDKRLENGDMLVLDFGCLIDGYASDMTRTVAIGEPDKKQREVYELVLAAQLAALDAVHAGVRCNEIDKIARDMLDATEYKGLFGHGLGHSLGLEIHESPSFSPRCEDKLPEGCLISVEPGLYLPGEFGVRIEDIVVATAEGCENLTKSPKKLIII